MENLNKTQKIVLITIATLMLLVIGYYFMQKTNKYDTFEMDGMLKNNSSPQNGFENPKTQEEIVVIHITGAVKEEGVFSIPEGSRIIDVIEEAGGIEIDAELSRVNLAYKVSDGQKIYIPSIYDEETEEVVSSLSGENIIVDGNTGENRGLVNINKATQTELETLTGIGPSTALKIIEYRKQNGEFKNIEEIMNVPGIGQSKFEAIKNNICIK